jgi:hypothetical protein
MKHFNENFLYHIWDGFHFINPLKAVSGKKLEIIFQGRWNTFAGPDFLNAIIKIDDKLIKGDIEIHINSYDWKRHNHHEDKNYNNVILHVVFEHNLEEQYTVTENGKRIEIVKIGNFLDESIKKLLARYEFKFEPKDKFCGFFAGEPPETVKALLNKLGLQRLENKIKRFDAELNFHSFEQIIYSALLEALGYSKNKFQMIKVAEQLPYKMLRKFYSQGMTYEEFIALVIVYTNLINALPSSFPKQFKNKWIELYNKQDFIKDQTLTISWNTFRIRPVNNPAIRFLQLSDLIYKSFEKGMENYIFSLFTFSKEEYNLKDFKKNLYDFFSYEADYFPLNYKMGKSRIDTILINIIIPISILYAKKMQYNNLKTVAQKIFTEYPATTDNFILDFMSKYMDSNQRKIIKKKSLYQQGMLNIYYSFCNNHLCDFCVENKKEMIKDL